MTSNRYSDQCQGPFDVFIQPVNKDSPSLHPTTVGRILSSNKQDIVEIKKVGFSKITVQLKSRQAANNLIGNPILKSKNLFAPLYLPFGFKDKALFVAFR